MNRVKRPDTWLHRPMLHNVKNVLANPEPSTHDRPACSNDAAFSPINFIAAEDVDRFRRARVVCVRLTPRRLGARLGRFL
jgi:hypothetical protein